MYIADTCGLRAVQEKQHSNFTDMIVIKAVNVKTVTQICVLLVTPEMMFKKNVILSKSLQGVHVSQDHTSEKN